MRAYHVKRLIRKPMQATMSSNRNQNLSSLWVSLSPTFSRALRRLNVFVLSQSMLNDCYTHGTTVYVSITYGLFSFFACRCQTLSSLRNADFLYGRDRRFSSETKSTYRKTSKQQLSRIFLKRKSNANEDFTMHNGAMAEMSNASRSGQGNSSSGSSQNAREEKLLVCQIESGLWTGNFCCWWSLLRITDVFFTAGKATEQVEGEEPCVSLSLMHQNTLWTCMLIGFVSWIDAQRLHQA